MYNLRAHNYKCSTKNRISQVISNLLTNAVKFTKEDRGRHHQLLMQKERGIVLL